MSSFHKSTQTYKALVSSWSSSFKCLRVPLCWACCAGRQSFYALTCWPGLESQLQNTNQPLIKSDSAGGSKYFMKNNSVVSANRDHKQTRFRNSVICIYSLHKKKNIPYLSFHCALIQLCFNKWRGIWGLGVGE